MVKHNQLNSLDFIIKLHFSEFPGMARAIELCMKLKSISMEYGILAKATAGLANNIN